MKGGSLNLTQEDRAVLERGRWAQRGGFGQRPAILVIDAQIYMLGERGGNQEAYRYSCGDVGWRAVDQAQRILEAARAVLVPIVFTRLIIDGSVEGDGGVFGRKVGLLPNEFAFFKGTHGSQLVAELAPRPGELVLEKKRFSAFFGTPLLAHLVERGVDTVLVLGGSTSNCVRATVVDAASYNFRTVVAAEAVFDRIPLCHQVSLFDMNRSYADVVPCEEVIGYLRGLPPAIAAGGTRGTPG